MLFRSLDVKIRKDQIFIYISWSTLAYMVIPSIYSWNGDIHISWDHYRVKSFTTASHFLCWLSSTFCSLCTPSSYPLHWNYNLSSNFKASRLWSWLEKPFAIEFCWFKRSPRHLSSSLDSWWKKAKPICAWYNFVSYVWYRISYYHHKWYHNWVSFEKAWNH